MAAKKQAAKAEAVETDDADVEEVDDYGLEFDPSDYTAAEILEYVKKNPEDRQHVRDAEAAGKARVTILNALDEEDDGADDVDEEDEAPKSRSKVKVSDGVAEDQPLQAVAMAAEVATPSLKRARVKGSFKLYYGRQQWVFEDDHTYELPDDLYQYLKGYGNIYDTAR